MPPKKQKPKNGREPKLLPDGRQNPKYKPRVRQYQKFLPDGRPDPAYYEGFHGLKDEYIRKMCHRAGVKRIALELYPMIRIDAKDFCDSILTLAMKYATHAKRKTVSTLDVLYAIRAYKRSVCAGEAAAGSE